MVVIKIRIHAYPDNPKPVLHPAAQAKPVTQVQEYVKGPVLIYVQALHAVMVKPAIATQENVKERVLILALVNFAEKDNLHIVVVLR